MMARVERGAGFLAALDQSGGSTPGALRLYGIPDDAYSGAEEMFAKMHEMRVRIITSAPFDGKKILGAILFERTMDGTAKGAPVPSYLWREKNIVPLLKVDEGLEAEADGVRLMKPMPKLDALLERAVRLGIFGTKMRSVISKPSTSGIAAIVEQQFAFAARILAHGLVPIVEPEVSIDSPEKARSEALLLEGLKRALDGLPGDHRVMLKLTIPDTPDFYADLVDHPKVARVVALSGGYTRRDACARLAANHGVIASFSRALTEDLRVSMDEAAFEAKLGETIDEIFQASTVKT
jgi:fructose-bisphosphate aldolase class I